MIIECKDITKVYGSGAAATTVLKGVSFEIEEGDFVAIIGPSGSGKSTLMHILGALDTATNGVYRLAGRDISGMTEDELADVRSQKIGFVFQAFNLLSRTTVLRNVELPMIYSDTPVSERESKARAALKSAGLDEQFYGNSSNQLSGGQMQRVAIARALVNDPAIILADEPTGNLDQKTGAIVLETFQRLNDEGRTIILITHDSQVGEHARRIIKITDGKILEDRRNSPKRIAESKDLT